MFLSSGEERGASTLLGPCERVKCHTPRQNTHVRILSLWGASYCVMYTYTSQIYLWSQLRIYWCYFYSLFTICSGLYGPSSDEVQLLHLHILKKPSILQRIRCFTIARSYGKICKWCSCISPDDGPWGPEHVVNRENKCNTNKFSVAIAGILDRYTYHRQNFTDILQRVSRSVTVQDRVLHDSGTSPFHSFERRTIDSIIQRNVLSRDLSLEANQRPIIF
jgi:hypothetical protein